MSMLRGKNGNGKKRDAAKEVSGKISGQISILEADNMVDDKAIAYRAGRLDDSVEIYKVFSGAWSPAQNAEAEKMLKAYDPKYVKQQTVTTKDFVLSLWEKTNGIVGDEELQTRLTKTKDHQIADIIIRTVAGITKDSESGWYVEGDQDYNSIVMTNFTVAELNAFRIMKSELSDMRNSQSGDVSFESMAADLHNLAQLDREMQNRAAEKSTKYGLYIAKAQTADINSTNKFERMCAEAMKKIKVEPSNRIGGINQAFTRNRLTTTPYWFWKSGQSTTAADYRSQVLQLAGILATMYKAEDVVEIINLKYAKLGATLKGINAIQKYGSVSDMNAPRWRDNLSLIHSVPSAPTSFVINSNPTKAVEVMIRIYNLDKGDSSKIKTHSQIMMKMMVNAFTNNSAKNVSQVPKDFTSVSLQARRVGGARKSITVSAAKVDGAKTVTNVRTAFAKKPRNRNIVEYDMEDMYSDDESMPDLDDGDSTLAGMANRNLESPTN